MTTEVDVVAEQQFADNPAMLVRETFERIHQERMLGLPVINPALSVDCVGFRPWRGHWIGMVITPWFLNVVLLRGTEGEWPETKCGDQRRFKLPNGELLFMASEEEGLGSFYACSLASPMHDFKSQEAAQQTALESMRLLMMPPVTVAEPAVGNKPQMSRREFLRGKKEDSSGD